MGSMRGTPPMCLLPHGTAHLKDGAYREGRATSADGAANLHDGAYAGGAGPQGRRLRFFLTDKALLLYGRQFFLRSRTLGNGFFDGRNFEPVFLHTTEILTKKH
jgi:hypothetical protein